MEMGFFNISIRRNTMDNGRTMFVGATELITILTETGMKANGTGTFRTELELITTRMEIFIKVSG